VLQNFNRSVERRRGARASLRASSSRSRCAHPPRGDRRRIFAFIVSFDQFPISLFLVAPRGEELPSCSSNYMKFDLDGAIAAGVDGVDRPALLCLG